MSSSVARADEINGAPIDRFTTVHGAFGFLMGAVGLSFGTAATVAIAWEFLERDLKRRWPDVFPHPSQDTPTNAAVDCVAALLGWAAGRRTR